MGNEESVYVQTTGKIMEVLQNASSTAKALADCLEVICGAAAAPQGSVWLASERGDKLFAVADTGGAELFGNRVAMGEGLVGRVVTRGNTHMQLYSEVRTCLRPEERGVGLPDGYMLWVPMIYGEKRLGCIQLGSRGEHTFSEKERGLCEGCAAIIAMQLAQRGLDALPGEDRRVLISARGVCKDFMTADLPTRVLKHVSLDICEGEMVVILGESGSGKSTLLNLLGGMDSPTEGELLVEGEDLSTATESELTLHRRNRVGFIFQSYNLMPNLTAVENVAFTAEISSSPMDPFEAIALVGLRDRANYYPSALSGGQQQRVAIARAIAKSPRMILADEPTASLDYHTAIGVLELLQSIVRERGLTLVMATHNMEIAKMADRIIRLKDGGIHSIRVNPAPLSASKLTW